MDNHNEAIKIMGLRSHAVPRHSFLTILVYSFQIFIIQGLISKVTFVTFNLAPSKIAFNLYHWMYYNFYKKM